MLTAAPTPTATAKGGRGKSTTPVCPLKCPDGYQVAVFSWELHPERTIYDETGQVQIAPDSLWPITCALRCEQHAVNTETKVWKDSKELCKSGGEPSPYRGPWRNSGQFGKECAATAKDGCGMHCYAIPPSRKNSAKGGKGTKAGPAKR
jgi:hypothetical protein